MSDRGVFAASFLTAILIVAGAFVLPQFFFFVLAKSAVFVAIAVMAYFGEDLFTYMLGVVYPLLWFVIDIGVGSFVGDFRALAHFAAWTNASTPESPLIGLARLAAIVLVIASYRAWRKEVRERFWGRTFVVCLLISLAYAALLAAWYSRIAAS
jgi:hypothetical protein